MVLYVLQIRYARFLRTYAKSYCTETTVSPFLIYFPFILFLVPTLIIFIEKGLIRYGIIITQGDAGGLTWVDLFEMFRRPAWAQGSDSSSPSARGILQI